MQFVRYNSGAGPTGGIRTDDGIHTLADLPMGKPSYQDLGNRRYLDGVERVVENGTLTEIPGLA